MFIPSFDDYQRTAISPDVLRMCCVFAKGDPSLPLDRSSENWQEIFEAVCRNGLLGLTYQYLSQNQPASYISGEFRTAIRKAHELTAIRMALLFRNITDILGRLNESEIPYRVVKGPILACAVYPDPNLRSFNDLDIVVREKDWPTIDRFLVLNGFTRQNNSFEPPPHLIPQDVKQETHYLNEKQNFLIEIHYDDILNAGLATRDLEGFWNRSISQQVFGIPVYTWSLEDQIIYLSAHLHHHGYSRLIWFSDLIFLIDKNKEKINWRRIIETVKVEEAQTPVFYSLRVLEKLMGVEIPKVVFDEIQPDRFRLFMHEKFWPSDQILSFQPLYPYYFSFYFIPFYKRLLPDFLVMGRRREKISYLLNLFYPPYGWLVNYYHLKENNPWNKLYRMIHPLRIFQVFIFETISELIDALKRIPLFRKQGK